MMFCKGFIPGRWCVSKWFVKAVPLGISLNCYVVFILMVCFVLRFLPGGWYPSHTRLPAVIRGPLCLYSYPGDRAVQRGVHQSDCRRWWRDHRWSR